MLPLQSKQRQGNYLLLLLGQFNSAALKLDMLLHFRAVSAAMQVYNTAEWS
jgi:hypothetical protein